MISARWVARIVNPSRFLYPEHGELLYTRAWTTKAIFSARNNSSFPTVVNQQIGRMSMSPQAAPELAPVPITTAPAADQLVEHDGKKLSTIKEGLAYILIPPEAPLAVDPTAAPKTGPQRASVFYNPIQQYNRDLTVLVIKAFGEDFLSKQQASAARHNRSNKAKKQRRRKGPSDESQKSVVPEPVKQDEYDSSREKRHVSPEKRKRETEEASAGVSSGDAQNNEKRAKIDNESFTTTTSLNQDQPLFSSMVKDRISTQEEVDDSFGDGGIAEEDFFIAEQNAKQAGMLPGTQNQIHGNKIGEAFQVDNESRKRPRFRILDALSASGLRALRYAKELPFVTSITANDLSPDAVASIKLNIQHNGITDPELVKVSTGNAVSHMANFMGPVKNKYTVIDLDPYGTAVPFLDTAVQAVADDGLLCVTCTDTAIFNSMGYLEKTFSQYGGLPIKGDFCHEAGVRLILHAIASAAGRYGIAIEPLLSLSIDYYARVFVRIRRSAAEVKFLGGKTMAVYNCDAGCGSWTAQPLIRIQEKPAKNGESNFKFSSAQGPTTPPLCEFCGNKRHLGGPMWGGPLHNPAFIEKILETIPNVDTNVYRTTERIKGQLHTALEETTLYEVPQSVSTKAKETVLPGAGEVSAEFARVPAQIVDKHPFYFDPSSLSRVLHCCAPSNAQMQGALRHQGYRCVRTHAKAGGIKTDAPFKVLWRVMKAWIATQPEFKAPKIGTAGYKIWNGFTAQNEPFKDPQQPDSDKEEKEIVFDAELGRQDTGLRGLVRFQANPRENWGPMAKAKGSWKPRRE